MTFDPTLIVLIALASAALGWFGWKRIESSLPKEKDIELFEFFDSSTGKMICPSFGSANAKITKLAVKKGDVISVGQTLVLIESELAQMEIPSPVTGTVSGVLIQNGQTVAAKDPIFILSQTNV